MSAPDSDHPVSNAVADAIVARIRALSRAHGAAILDDATLAELMTSLKIDNQVPVAAFSVAADLLFHLLAADQRPLAETMP